MSSRLDFPYGHHSRGILASPVVQEYPCELSKTLIVLSVMCAVKNSAARSSSSPRLFLASLSQAILNLEWGPL